MQGRQNSASVLGGGWSVRVSLCQVKRNSTVFHETEKGSLSLSLSLSLSPLYTELFQNGLLILYIMYTSTVSSRRHFGECSVGTLTREPNLSKQVLFKEVLLLLFFQILSAIKDFVLLELAFSKYVLFNGFEERKK